MRRFLLLFAMLLVPALTLAQGGSVTLVRSSAEPLPFCTPAVQPYQSQPIVWDVTSQQLKVCTATNIWTAIPNAAGTGTVSIVSVAGTTAPLMTVTVATATTTPAITFALSTAAAHTVYIGPVSGG